MTKWDICLPFEDPRKPMEPDYTGNCFFNEKNGSRLATETEIEKTYLKKDDGLYGSTYICLDILQKVVYTNNGVREAFVNLCESKYV